MSHPGCRAPKSPSRHALSWAANPPGPWWWGPHLADFLTSLQANPIPSGVFQGLAVGNWRQAGHSAKTQWQYSRSSHHERGPSSDSCLLRVPASVPPSLRRLGPRGLKRLPGSGPAPSSLVTAAGSPICAALCSGVQPECSPHPPAELVAWGKNKVPSLPRLKDENEPSVDKLPRGTPLPEASFSEFPH